ncbi:MAG: hypothetical protein AB8C46_16715 [Burkholderiaceae bacterium]
MPAEHLISICGPIATDVLSRHCCNDACWVESPGTDSFAPVRQALGSDAGRLTLARLNQALASSQSAREFRRWMAQAQRQAAHDEMPLLLAFQRYFDRLAVSN